MRNFFPYVKFLHKIPTYTYKNKEEWRKGRVRFLLDFFTQERVEYNVFLFDEPLKGSKSLKIFKINLTFHFDKLSHLAKSVHIGENSQILTVSNKKNIFCRPL
jgi:hypothetical protein